MLFGRQAPRVLVYEHPVDMRKSFDGLHAIASQIPGRRPIGVAVPLHKPIEDDYEDSVLGSDGMVRGWEAPREPRQNTVFGLFCED